MVLVVVVAVGVVSILVGVGDDDGDDDDHDRPAIRNSRILMCGLLEIMVPFEVPVSTVLVSADTLLRGLSVGPCFVRSSIFAKKLSHVDMDQPVLNSWTLNL